MGGWGWLTYYFHNIGCLVKQFLIIECGKYSAFALVLVSFVVCLNQTREINQAPFMFFVQSTLSLNGHLYKMGTWCGSLPFFRN